jgi:hypothetical protein
MVEITIRRPAIGVPAFPEAGARSGEKQTRRPSNAGMSHLLRHASVLCLLLMSIACGGGGGGGGTPTGPAPTVSSLAITLGDMLLVGRTVNATATATMSNGQTQAVTSGWVSSATHVATVTDAGVVRGVGNGTSVITVNSGGQQASRTIRVAPDFDGRWSGVQIVTACRDSLDLRGICQEPEFAAVIGSAYAISLTARQAGGLDVAGEFVVEGITYPTFTTSVADDGTIRFSSTAEEDGVRGMVSWVMQSTFAGRGTGTIVETYTFPGLATGELVWESTFSDLLRAGTSAQALESPDLRTKLVQRLRRDRRR